MYRGTRAHVSSGVDDILTHHRHLASNF